jgi:hypothetical protein
MSIQSRAKHWLFKKLFNVSTDNFDVNDAPAQRDPAETTVKRIGLRMGDVTSKDFEEPEFDLSQVQLGYNTDSYIRQGVDKYIDQIFKEGYEFYGKNQQTVDFLKLRLRYIAEVTKSPTGQFLTDIAEDFVKYSNCFVAKARAKDPNQLPPGVTLTGIGGLDPVAGYFPVNATTIKLMRDKFGVVKRYQQEVEGGDKPVKFRPEDIVHFFYKREKGNAFGTPFLWPVLDDVRALRQAEENVLRMMYRNIHPFNHVMVGDNETPGTAPEIAEVQDALDNMEVDGGIVTSNRVAIKPIASDQVINAEPYLKHIEARVFSGMGIPAILFGRGDTANRSTGDNQSSEMSDRIKAIQRSIEAFFNEFIIRELLLEGGYDPVLNQDDDVIFKFKENDLDTLIKYENHVIYKFEHNAIPEPEMRYMLNLDPIAEADRQFLNRELSASLAMKQAEAKAAQQPGTSKTTATGASKSAENKNKPTNQYGKKTSPKKTSDDSENINLIDEVLLQDY